MLDDHPHGGHPPLLRDAPRDLLCAALSTDTLPESLKRCAAAELHRRSRREPLVRCEKCGRGPAACLIYWAQLPGGVRAVVIECERCAWVGHLPATPAYAAAADAGTSPTAVLDALTLAEQEGVRIVWREGGLGLLPCGRASARLERLVRMCAWRLMKQLPASD
jgi:hypothetical protein